MTDFKVINKNIEKLDGFGLVFGKPVYTGDINTNDMLHIKLLTSPVPHAKIKKIDISKAQILPGVKCILYYKNVPRIPRTTAGQGYPEPSPYDSFLFDDKVRYVGDKVAAVAARNKEIAEEAIKLIDVEYEELEYILDPRKATDPNSPIIHDEKDCKIAIPVIYEPEKNICAKIEVNIGDPDKALKDSDYVLEKMFYSPRTQHCATERHIARAHLDQNGRIVITTSTQVPFHVRRIVAQTLGISEKKIRVIKPRIGGGFGGKQEIYCEDIVALVTLRTGMPSILEFDRDEVFMLTRTRHEQYIKLQTGFNKSGNITCFNMDVLSNTGAYGSHALTVLCNSGNKALPMYHCSNIRFNGMAVYTNTPVAGACRGYGATQAAFAMEVMIDEMAHKLNIDPVDFRLKHHIKENEGSEVFEKLGEGKEGIKQIITSCALSECIKIGAKEIGWKEKFSKLRDCSIVKRGVGMAALMQGSGVPEIDMASASLKLNDDGSFNLLVGATDVGTGSDTILAQIAAEGLGVGIDSIIVYSSDTDITPFDVGAYASSTTYLSGQAVQKVVNKVKKQIIQVACNILNEKHSDYIFENACVKSLKSQKILTLREIALLSLYQKQQFQIGAIDSAISNNSPPPFAAHFVEIDVDTETGKIFVVKYVAVVDCGIPINPKLAEGQTEGAVLMGLTNALTEEHIFNKKGKMLNPNFRYYKLFKTTDIPEIKTILVPSYEPTGPYGAKSIGEISVNGAMPAISNAIYNATGVRITKAPFTPQNVLKELQKSN